MQSPDHVRIFDTTLRDGEQAPGASMTITEKVDIARQLAKLRVDIIEAGFPVSSPIQFEGVQRVVAALDQPDDPVVCALARAVELDIDHAGRSLAGGEQTRIHTFIATSDIHIDAKFGHPRFGATLAEKRQTILAMTQAAVQQARTFTDDVEFSAEDAGRTDVGYLCDVIAAAVEAGATTINIPDTTGYCTPSEYARLFERAAGCIGDRKGIIFSAHCHDDLGLAVANSLSAVLAGARQLECTINGIGERAGNASLEEIVMALRVRADRFGADTRIDSTQLMQTSQMVSVACGFAVPPNKAIVGRNAFSHEAGIHQHGVLKRRDTYEIMRAEDVGQAGEQIRLGRHSGRHGFFSRLAKLGLDVAEEDRQPLYQAFLALADHKKEIVDEDLVHLVQGQGPAPSKPAYELVEVDVRVGTGDVPHANVGVRDNDNDTVYRTSATGDGPIDAICRAINAAVGEPHQLVSYSLQSLTGGTDALGDATVVIVAAGQPFRGTGRHTDVIQASANAYMEALNRMHAHRTGSDNIDFAMQGVRGSFG